MANSFTEAFSRALETAPPRKAAYLSALLTSLNRADLDSDPPDRVEWDEPTLTKKDVDDAGKRPQKALPH